MEQSRPTRITNKHPAKYFISFFSSKKLKNQNISPKKKNPLKRTFNNSVCFLENGRTKVSNKNWLYITRIFVSFQKVTNTNQLTDIVVADSVACRFTTIPTSTYKGISNPRFKSTSNLNLG